MELSGGMGRRGRERPSSQGRVSSSAVPAIRSIPSKEGEREEEREGIMPKEWTEDETLLSSSPPSAASLFKKGQAVKVVVVQFGPLGATVDIEDGKARGLIIQREISMFRDRRGGRDVVVGEELEGFIRKKKEVAFYFPFLPHF